MSDQEKREPTAGEKRAAEMVKRALQKAGFRTVTFHDGSTSVLNASRKWCAFLGEIAQEIADAIDGKEAAP